MKQKTQWQQKGQSLVEVAIFLPVALVILAGLVELSLYLVTQNRVNTAAREAARFGAAGGQDAGMVTVALNTVTQTLQLEVDRWDLWSVHGRVRARCLSGTSGQVTLDFGSNDQDFTVIHTYGISQTVAYTETTNYLYSAQFRQEVLDELVLGGVGNCSVPNNPAPDINGLEFVGMYAAHDVESILGLDVFLENVFTVRALQTFRVTSVVSNDQLQGCDAFPIVLDQRIRSMDATEYGTALSTPSGDRYPTALPAYHDLEQEGHVRAIPLENLASEGVVYLFEGRGHIQSGATDIDNFNWLQWNIDTACPGCSNIDNRLATSMTWPGNTHDATLGFHQVGNNQDTELSVDDRVAYSAANNSAAIGTPPNGPLPASITRGRTLRVMLAQEDDGSAHQWVKVAQFANVRILGYKLVGDPSTQWLLVQFVSYDTSCGQVASTP